MKTKQRQKQAMHPEKAQSKSKQAFKALAWFGLVWFGF